MKKTLLLSALFLVFSISCKKTENKPSQLSVSELQKNRVTIAAIVKTQLDSAKTLVASTTKSFYVKNKVLQSSDPAEKHVVTYNLKPVKEYYNSVFKITNQKPSSTNLKIQQAYIDDNSNDGIITITDDYQSPYYPGINLNNIENSYIVSDETDYQQQYLAITEQYTDLNTYNNDLTSLENTIYSSQSSDDTKISLTYQIEFLKTYAYDLENNLGSYEDLITGGAPAGVESVKGIIINSTGLKVNKMANCHVNVRGVLLGAVVGGFVSGVRSGTVGAVAGTVTVPGIGTVTGAVSGFMSGFAVGFIGGVITGTVSELLGSCFQ